MYGKQYTFACAITGASAIAVLQLTSFRICQLLRQRPQLLNQDFIQQVLLLNQDVMVVAEDPVLHIPGTTTQLEVLHTDKWTPAALTTATKKLDSWKIQCVHGHDTLRWSFSFPDTDRVLKTADALHLFREIAKTDHSVAITFAEIEATDVFDQISRLGALGFDPIVSMPLSNLAAVIRGLDGIMHADDMPKVLHAIGSQATVRDSALDQILKRAVDESPEADHEYD